MKWWGYGPGEEDQYEADRKAFDARRAHNALKAHDQDEIVLVFNYPAIPIRDFDWQATYENYEPGYPVGFGRTPLDAIWDLFAEEDSR